MNRESARSKGEALKFIAKVNLAYSKKQMFYWVLNENLEMMGSICLWHFSEDGKSAEIGYDLHPQYQGQGFMREALEAIILFAKSKLQLQELNAFTHHANEKSTKLLKGTGFHKRLGARDPDTEDNVIFYLKL